MRINGEIVSEEDAKKVMEKLGTGRLGIKYMLPKTIFRLIKLEDIRNSPATILKQEMLAIGGDASVHEKTTRCLVKKTDVLLMGTFLHYEKLIKKLRHQPIKEAKAIAYEIERIIKLESKK